MSDLDLLMSVPTLMKLVEKFPSISEPLPYESLFRVGGVEECDGDRILYEKITNDRRLAAVRGPSSEAYVETASVRRWIDQGLIHTAVKEILHPSELYLRSGPGEWMRSNAEQVVIRTVRRLKSRARRLREYVCSTLLQSSTGVDLSDSNTAFPSGANTTVSTVTIDGSLQQIASGAEWATPSTKMLSDETGNQIPLFHRTFEGNGHAIGRIIIDRLTAAAISGNVEAQTWLVNQRGVSQEFIQQALIAIGRQGAAGLPGGQPVAPLGGSVFDGLGAIPRWDVWDHNYANRSGTVTRYTQAGHGIILPADEVLPDVLGFAEGPVFIPDNTQVMGDAEQAADLIQVRKGMVVFAYRTVDDTGNIVVVCRDCFCPFVRNELGVLDATGLRS